MYTTRLLAVLSILTAATQSAFGHGIPVFVTLGTNNRFVTDTDQYGSDLESLLGTLTTDLPGYSIDSAAAGVPVGTQLATAVIDKLWFSSGGPPVASPPSVSLEIQNATDDFITVNGSTTLLMGPIVGTYDGSAGWHEHDLYTLNPGDADPGAYGVLLQLTSPNHPSFKPSAPFVVVFNNGLDDAVFDGLADALANKALSTGDVNFDGIVDISDVQTVAANWLATAPHHPPGDANHDDIVDISDVQTIAINWLHPVGLQPDGAGSTVVPVPEPASGALALVAIVGLVVARVARRPRDGTAESD